MSNIPTFDEILKRMLDSVPSDVDKREGSIIYDALAPSAAELAQMYIQLQRVLDLAMLDTAEGEDLDRVANQYDMYRLDATPAVCKMVVVVDEHTGATIPLGSRFSVDGLSYSVTERLSALEYAITCETLGESGNKPRGTLIPLSFIEGLNTAELKEVMIYGEDTESDEAFRLRVKNALSRTSVDGNVNQYYQWGSEFSGVGRVKVFPLWLGGNTVKVSITDSNNQVASEELIDKFQEYLDPDAKGLGNGKAPIGAKVTVQSGTKKDIDIYVEVKLATGYTTAEGIAEAIVDFLSSISYIKNVISYMQLGSALLNLPSVADIRNMTVTGEVGDVQLGEEEIPMLNNLNVVVI